LIRNDSPQGRPIVDLSRISLADVGTDGAISIRMNDFRSTAAAAEVVGSSASASIGI
jgi:hypothetical protein